MNKQTKWIIGIVILLLAIWGVVEIAGESRSTNQDLSGEPIRIGAILPLSGPASIMGESIRNGMELKRQELSKENVFVEIIYEDSQADARQGLSAYSKLTQVDNVDAVISALSRVSVPLASRAQEDKIPLVATIVSAKDFASQGSYIFRLFMTPESQGKAFFDKLLSKNNYNDLAILSINDEYGVSVASVIEDEAQKNNIDIVTVEWFEPASADYRTQLTKIKSVNPDGIMLVTTIPLELESIIKQSKELNLELFMFDTTPLQPTDFYISQVGGLDNFFTLSPPFQLNETGEGYIDSYQKAYSEPPNVFSIFGYDTVGLIVGSTNGNKVSREELRDNIANLEQFESTNGVLEVKDNGEINPTLVPARVINGQFVKVE